MYGGGGGGGGGGDGIKFRQITFYFAQQSAETITLEWSCDAIRLDVTGSRRRTASLGV